MSSASDTKFHYLPENSAYSEPSQLLMVDPENPHPLTLAASQVLQQYLQTQQDWKHNFGLDKSDSGAVIGKMFGVLVVRNKENSLGFLAAFSGKLANSNTHSYFVDPIFDLLSKDGFLTPGMEKLTELNVQIRELQMEDPTDHQTINSLKTFRKAHSQALQQKIFEQYHFLNSNGESKSLYQLFDENRGTLPVAGAGECAAPKLLQHAFANNYKVVALAEFWWGESPKSEHWEHGRFYPTCKEKCEPILHHMLGSLNRESQ